MFRRRKIKIIIYIFYFKYHDSIYLNFQNTFQQKFL